MIQRVLTQQEEVWRDFVSGIWPELWEDTLSGRLNQHRKVGDDIVHANDPEKNANHKERLYLIPLVMRIKILFERRRSRISQLDEDAERVERSISIQLDLKQKHASLNEAHATAVVSAAVFGFAIVTIIFTPLSFVMSLFALPIDRFRNNQVPSRWTDEAGMYSTSYIGTWAATTEIVSMVLTVCLMWLALEYGLKYSVTRKIRNFLQAMPTSLKIVWTTCRQDLESRLGRSKLGDKDKSEIASPSLLY